MIVHFDIDAFYASVAQLDDPSLRGKPVAVSGESRRAVVLTASYEARPFGVRSAMPLYKARALCPDLLVARPNFDRYRELSHAVFAIIARGAGRIERLSFDEAYIDVESDDLAAVTEYARRVRAEVRREIGLTCSAGISTQKLVAKIASDAAKPDGLVAVEPGTEAAYLAPMPVGRLWGIGPKSERRLRERAFTTIGELAEISDAVAFELFGRSGMALRELARGHDPRRVESSRETRSVSSETTFEYDVTDAGELRRIVVVLADEVARRLQHEGLYGTTVGVKVKLADFTVRSRQTTVAVATSDARTIAACAIHTLERAELTGAAVRLLGVRVAGVTGEPARQTSLFASDVAVETI